MDKITEFRLKAKENIDLTTSIIDEMSEVELSQLVHELWSRQIALEIQNEELSKTQTHLETFQKRYTDLYNDAPIGYCVFDRDGLIRETNLTLAEQLGVKKGILLNTRFVQYLVEEDREIFSHHLTTLFVTQVRQMCEVRVLHTNGSQFYARLESIVGQEREEYVNQCRTAILDVTESKRTEKHFQEKEERLHHVIQTLPVMIAAFDENLSFIFWNRECEQMTGYRAEEIIGNPNAREVLYPDPPYRQRILTALLNEGKLGNFRNWAWQTTCKDGRIRTILWSSVSKQHVASGWYGWAIGVDITERKQAQEGGGQSQNGLKDMVKEHTLKFPQTTQQLHQEIVERKRFEQALETSQRQYRLLIEHVADGIAVIQEEKLTYANKTLLSLFGFPGEQLLGSDPASLVHHKYREHFREMLATITTSAPSQRFQVLCVTKAKREIWIEGDLSVIEWEGQAAVLATVRDITDRKHRQLTLEQEQTSLKKKLNTFQATIKDRYQLGDIIGKSAVMQKVYAQILKTATTHANVFLYGESGTGKELIARTIHAMSSRREQRFIPVNCGAIPESLFESEFFGHRKGSFTGAFRDKQGFFSAAHQGTLFLDELGELPLAMQVKLLRVLDDGEYTPVGETVIKKVNVRIIAATNRDVDDMRTRGLIREDLFFRLHVFAITVPPLRERKEDIPLFMDHFLKRYGHGETLSAIPGDIMEMLYNHDWPGNIREFQNALQRYLSGQLLQLDPRKRESLKTHVLSETESKPEPTEFHEVTGDFEKKLILSVLEQHRWNKSKTASILGIPRRTLYRKMEKYGIV